MRSRGITTLALAVALIVAAALPAYAAPQWSVVPSPSPPAPPTGSLAAIACPTATVCFSVGGDGPMAQRSNGSSWTLIPLPKPAGSTLARLEGIACPAATSCFAVGWWQPSQSGPQKTLIEHWTGSGWTIQASPNPTGATNALEAVTCPSPTSCFAVGSNQNGSTQKAIIVHWNGTAWAVQPSVNPAGNTFKYLRGIACASTTSCFAVGSVEAGANATPFAEHWNGSAWSLATLLNPAGSTRTRFFGVACPAALSCFAVGSSVVSGTEKTLVEHWSGSGWVVQTSANAAGFAASALFAVACIAPGNCFAVGEAELGAGFPGSGNTLVERLSGTTWSVVPSANPADKRGSSLRSIACPATTHCFAAGTEYFDNAAFVEEWSGSNWIVDAPPAGSSQSSLSAVTCPTTTSCFAVGLNLLSTGYKTVIEHWDGSAWKLMASPNPPGDDIRLTSVACATATNCFAVGTYANPSHYRTALIEHWVAGSGWKIEAAARPVVIPGSPPQYSAQTYFNSISCPSTSSCYAVGASDNSNGYLRTLVEHWNGTAWSVANVPTPTGAGDTILYGVSCATATSCFAVGSHSTASSSSVYIMRLNGTAWAQSAAPSPASAELTSVSCASASSCSALGHQSSGILAERWNGSSWTQVAVPAPAGSFLDGVSCPLGTAICWAVGRHPTGSSEVPIAERWNGSTWANVAIPGKPGAASWLSGVTCSSAVLCRAVGGYNANNNLFTLVEQYQ